MKPENAVTIARSVAVDVDANRVWSVLRDVGAIATWLPGTESSRMEGDVRVIEYAGGGQSREQILAVDDDELNYHYRLVSGRLPLKSYEARLSVEPQPGGALVRWSGSFVPNRSDDASTIAATLTDFYESSLKRLRQRLSQHESKEK